MYEDFGFLECWQGNKEIVPEVCKKIQVFIFSVMQSKKSLFLDQLNYLTLKNKAVRIFETPWTNLPNDITQIFQKLLILNTSVYTPENSRSLYKISGFSICKYLHFCVLNYDAK
jgi:hypothetical protein